MIQQKTKHNLNCSKQKLSTTKYGLLFRQVHKECSMLKHVQVVQYHNKKQDKKKEKYFRRSYDCSELWQRTMKRVDY